MRLGEFLLNNKYITKEQLNIALQMQKDNSAVLLGEILVTQGSLTQDNLIKYVESFVIQTGSNPSKSNEWLPQEEIDRLMVLYKKMYKKE